MAANPLLTNPLRAQPMIVFVIGALMSVNLAQGQVLEASEQQRWLLEKLRSATPAPQLAGEPYTLSESQSPQQNTIISRDSVTGIETLSPASAIAAGLYSLPSQPGLGASEKISPTVLSTKSMPWAKAKKTQAPPLVSVEGLDQAWSAIVTQATAPALLLETTQFPHNTVHKMLMEFFSSTSGEFHYYVCTGWSTGSFHIATAGHCVYNFDPNGDGNSVDAAWATQIWTWAAQTDRVEPFGVADFPYGVSQVVYQRSYTGWTTSQNYAHDWALVTLDRRQGDHTGWMGRETGVSATSLNFTGYPAEAPYVPSDSLGQYPGYDANNVLGYTSYRIQMDALTYGGHSGGPSWRFDTDRYVQGIHSTSDRLGNAEDTLLTTNKYSDINTWMSDDEINRAPIAQPNLIEYWFETDAKDLITNAVNPGGIISVEYNVMNVGFAAAANTRLDFYLSTNTIISASDTLLGNVTISSLPAWSHANNSANFTVPVSVPQGNYYVGWLLSTDTSEYNIEDNQVVISAEQLNVSSAAPCTPDGYEPDDSAGSASTIALNSLQTHSICAVGDEDWVSFTLAQDSQVIVETSGASGDSRMWLYNAALTQLEYDDDGGASLFSRIDRLCGTDHLGPGTYWVKIDEYNNDNEIPSYDLNLTATTCVGLEPDITITPLNLTFTNGDSAAPGSNPTTPEDDVSLSVNAKKHSPQLQAGSKKKSSMARFRRGPINPQQKNNRLNKSRLAEDGRRHMLMQFDEIPDRIARAELAGRGIKLLSYIPDQAFWVSVDNNASSADARSRGGRRAWIPDPIHKTSPRIDANDFPVNTRHGDGTVSLQVLLFEDVNQQQVINIIDGLRGGIAVVRPLGKQLLEVRSPRGRIMDISNLDEVRWIEPARSPRQEQNAVAASRVNADLLLSSPYNLDGAAITVGVWDGGAVDTHMDFDSRLTVVDAVAVGSHGTHVAGTIGGSGSGNNAAAGMAPAVQLRSYDWNNDTNEMQTAAQSDNVVISNHSYGFATGWTWDGSAWIDYGSGGFGLYDSNSQAYDNIVYSTGLLVFKSAGNDRNDGPDCPSGPDCDGSYGTIGFIGNAKNVVSVCALSDSDNMSAFSSWGPTDDGRIKPDLCANGESLLSTLPGNSYGNSSGTSMSSPSAAGTAALLFEHFQNVTGTAPAPALLKTLMIHGATDLGATGPDYQFGWGIINSAVTADVISAGDFIQGVISGNGDQQEYTFEVSAAGTVRVTLGWTDPGGDPAAAIALVNDLNLELISPSSATYYPWVMDPANPANPASTGVNSLDNIEQVEIVTAEVGTWTARVSGFNVALGPQNFSLTGTGLGNSSSKIFTIANDGSTQLSVTAIAPETSAPWISINPTSTDLAPGATQPVQVDIDFGLAPAGNSLVRLLVSSNDPDENPYPGAVDVTVINDCANNDGDSLCDSIDPDDDNDGLTDLEEDLNDNGVVDSGETDPLNADTDGDGFDDGVEVDYNSDPLDPADVPANGDINSDGTVDIADLLLMNEILRGLRTPSPSEMLRADIAPVVGSLPTPDGVIDLADLLLLQRKLLAL